MVYLSLFQVDKHIRRLDADLARFEADLKDKLEGSDFESPVTQTLKSMDIVTKIIEPLELELIF